MLMNLVDISLRFLEAECMVVNLTSRVIGKRYFSFAKKDNPDALSRPVNPNLFNPNASLVSEKWAAFHSGQLNQEEIGMLLYTMAIAYSAASDLFDRNNKKAPATYFENLVGHLFAREFDVNPTKRVTLPIERKSVRMTMDFLFDLGEGEPKIHLPVKTSTRERVVQAWSHQRLLDAAFGHARYRGILVVHSETKLGIAAREVVEICVPDQWLAYQMYLAKMDRIYYFDIPERYAALSRNHPAIQIKQFPDFFSEKEVLLTSLTG
jgi:hypothetical protein